MAADRAGAGARRSPPGSSTAQPAAARGLRHRLLHPVRLHRHVHLREFRAGAPAAVARPDGARLRLFRVPAFDRHDAAGRPRGRSASAPGRPSGARWRWPAPGCRCFSCRVLPRSCWAWSLVGVGTFFAQATATGFVGRAATTDRGAASGIYLACYFSGGLVGSAVLGQLFDRIGWPACVGGSALSLAAASLLATSPENAHPQPTPI